VVEISLLYKLGMTGQKLKVVNINGLNVIEEGILEE